jgi:hypothetical protein
VGEIDTPEEGPDDADGCMGKTSTSMFSSLTGGEALLPGCASRNDHQYSA